MPLSPVEMRLLEALNDDPVEGRPKLVGPDEVPDTGPDMPLETGADLPPEAGLVWPFEIGPDDTGPERLPDIDLPVETGPDRLPPGIAPG